MLYDLFQLLMGFFRGSPRKENAAEPVAVPGEASPPARAPVAPKPERAPGEPAWLALARGEIGVRELAGEADNPKIMGYFKDAGFPGIDSETTSWCAGFANSMLERCGVPGSKSLAARSFLTWGKEVKKPYPGCVVVFWRGSPSSWQGHVGFWVGEDATHIRVLGGNQGDSVKIASYPKNQLLGYREPVTASNSRTFRAQTAGALGDGMTLAAFSGKAILDSLPDALAIGDGVASLAPYWPWFAALGISISILSRMITIYARLSDLSTKGA